MIDSKDSSIAGEKCCQEELQIRFEPLVVV